MIKTVLYAGVPFLPRRSREYELVRLRAQYESIQSSLPGPFLDLVVDAQAVSSALGGNTPPMSLLCSLEVLSLFQCRLSSAS